MNNEKGLKFAEQISEVVANIFIKEFIGTRTILRNKIELLLEENAHLIYQDIPDLEYFGATIKFESKEQFVLLNTYQPLRMRYFSAAHELWHLIELPDLESDFEHERAADHFAALIMIPELVARKKWIELLKQHSEETVIILLADYFSIPYSTMVRRLEELSLIDEFIFNKLDDYWLNRRKELQIKPSKLDLAESIVKFKAYEELLRTEVETGSLDRQEASIKLAHVSPKNALEIQRTNQDSISIDLDDDGIC